MGIYAKIIKNLPNNLQNLQLDLSYNNLGDNTNKQAKLLGELLNYIPIHLKNLHLNLSNNNLGDNIENIKYLG